MENEDDESTLSEIAEIANHWQYNCNTLFAVYFEYNFTKCPAT